MGGDMCHGRGVTAGDLMCWLSSDGRCMRVKAGENGTARSLLWLLHIGAKPSCIYIASYCICVIFGADSSVIY